MHKTKSGKSAPKGALPGRHKGDPIPVALKAKAVKLHLEESVPQRLICEQLHINRALLFIWLKKYREEGEAGDGGRE